MNRLRYYILNCTHFVLVLTVLVRAQSLWAQQFDLFGDAPAQPNAAAQNALQRQIRELLEPMLKAELSFANRAAKPSDDERRALIAAAVEWLDEFADEFSKKQDRNEQQMWLQGVQRVVVGGSRDSEDPRETIELGVAKLVVALLPAEKAAAYEKQVHLRDVFRRDVTIANLVEQLDEKLILATEQREKITATLSEHWDHKWAPQIESFTLGRNFFSPLPKQWIRPELTAAQLAAFDRLNGSSQEVVFDGMAFGGRDNEVIDDVDLKEHPLKADEKPAANQPVVANRDQATE